MTLPRMHDDREFCKYHNDLGQSVGECALEVRGWLAEHPEYSGRIFGDWDTGGPRDQFDASELFYPERYEDAEAVETIAETPVSAKDFRPVPTTIDEATTRLCDDIIRTRRVA